MKKYIFLLSVNLFGNFLFAQEDIPFYFPVTQYETTQTLGYKPGAKNIIEYVNENGFGSKTEKTFNKKGLLTSEESYTKNEEGYHLNEKIDYHFHKDRLTEIEALFEVNLMDIEDNIDEPVYKTAYETETADYTYDKKGRLKTYTVLDRYYDNPVFHISYPNENLTQYYYMETESDSILVYEFKVIENNEVRTEKETKYNNGDIEYTNERYFKNGKAYKFISESPAGNKTTKYSSELNEYGDETEFIVSEKQDNETGFKETWHEYLTYEYDENGIKLKEYHTNEFENNILYEEKKIEYKDNQKIINTKNYSGNDWVNTETIETYNVENELISRIVKEKYDQDEDFTETKTTTYKLEYTFY